MNAHWISRPDGHRLVVDGQVVAYVQLHAPTGNWWCHNKEFTSLQAAMEYSQKHWAVSMMS